MKVKVSNEKVFWNSITDNKPSQTYFEQFVARMEEKEIQVNQDNFLNITIATPNRDITYLSIEHRDYVGYYFYNSIQKITNGGYVINFKLDIWTTFTLPFLKNLQDNNVKVKAIRNHILEKTSAFYNDEMKNAVPITYNGIKQVKTKISDYGYYVENNKMIWKCKIYGNNDWATNGQWLQIEYNSTWKPDSDNSLLANGCLCYVYKINHSFGDVPSNYLIIPAFYKCVPSDMKMYFCNPNDIIVQQRKVEIFNNLQDLTYFTSNAKYQKSNTPQDDDPSLNANFLGVFCLPSIFSLKYFLTYNIQLGYDFAIIYTGTKSNPTKYNLMCLRGDLMGQVLEKDINILQKEFDFIPQNEQVPSLNYDEKLHALVADAYTFKWFNNIIKPSLFYEKDKGITFSKIMWGISQEAFLKVYTSNGYNSEHTFYLCNELPSFEDSYSSYMLNTRNQRDNQLNIWKQNLILGATQNIFNAATSTWIPFGKMVLGRKYGDQLAFGQGLSGTLSGITNLGFGLANNILGYKQQISSLNAQYADYASTVGNNVNLGSVEDILNSSLNYLTSTPSYTLEYKDLTKDTIRQLNNILYLYGNYNPKFDTLNNLQPRQDFNYLLLEEEYLKTIFSQYINNNVPIEVYSLILGTLTSGVRICKTNTPMSN